MVTGKINITFNAMLKFYHIMLAKNKIKHKEFGIVMLDEAGDLNMVTLEIFKLLPSPLKILVGDNRQNIYGFNGTINGFKELDSESTTLNMTKSFRCLPEVAESIETFCNNHMDEDMSFKGTIRERPTSMSSLGYIARNNSTLITKMIELDLVDIPYNLTRPAKTIFELMLFLMFLKPGNKKIYNDDFLHIQKAYDEYSGNNDLKIQFRTFFNYAKALFDDDINLSSAIGIILANSRDTIFQTYENAKKHEKERQKHFITLGTGHSTKGCEYDIVELAPDLKKTFERCKANKERAGSYSDNDIQELNLIYVAASRAKYELRGATWMWSTDI
jgi:superfamily I DNA/RNA helicase